MSLNASSSSVIVSLFLYEIKRTNENCTKGDHYESAKHHQHKSYKYIPHWIPFY
jgi:hypothetical protein